MIDVSELLPIGSVVQLKAAEKRLMIFGVKQAVNGVDYDYSAVPYPQGFTGENIFLFNHEDINETYFRGCENEERNEFISTLSQFYKNL